MGIKMIISLYSMLALILATTGKHCGRTSESDIRCTFRATAQDYSGLDGCGMLLVLENGNKLLATNLDSVAPEIRDGDVVRISYTATDAMVSTCMAEQTIVRLTCFTTIAASTGCPKMVDPNRLAWSQKVMTELDPRQVESLKVDGNPSYRFVGKTESRIYTCTGDLVCAYPNGDRTRCAEVLDKITDATIIYIVNE